MAVALDLGQAQGPSRLDISDVVSEDHHKLILSGELDIASAPELQPLVVSLCADGVRGIVLDLSRLTFIDSSGLQCILSAQSVCRDHGVDFALVPATGAANRIFELAGLTGVLPFREA